MTTSNLNLLTTKMGNTMTHPNKTISSTTGTSQIRQSASTNSLSTTGDNPTIESVTTVLEKNSTTAITFPIKQSTTDESLSNEA